MDDGSINIKKDRLAEERARVFAMPLEDINPAQPALFQQDLMWPTFERLRAQSPVHSAWRKRVAASRRPKPARTNSRMNRTHEKVLSKW